MAGHACAGVLLASSLIALSAGLQLATYHTRADLTESGDPWPLVCTAVGSSWNQTRCPDTSTCCANGFSGGDAKGCCPWPDAVCCSNGFQCCPSGTTCVSAGGSSFTEIFNCVAPNTTKIADSVCVCKPGPPLSLDSKRKNVLIIGDSLTIGYTPFVADELADIALVQHAPWDINDGGAEETAYGLQCLSYWLASPSGISLLPGLDLIYFNFGMHNGPLGNDTIPGQQGNTSVYGPQLRAIALQLRARAAAYGVKLMYGLTTAFLCAQLNDGCIINLNNQATAIMTELQIPMVNLHDAIVSKCGPVPQATCFDLPGCFCPHCNAAGYSWLANSTIAPAIRSALTSGSAGALDGVAQS